MGIYFIFDEIATKLNRNDLCIYNDEKSSDQFM